MYGTYIATLLGLAQVMENHSSNTNVSNPKDTNAKGLIPNMPICVANLAHIYHSRQFHYFPLNFFKTGHFARLGVQAHSLSPIPLFCPPMKIDQVIKGGMWSSRQSSSSSSIHL
jgi:hypothetical protein